MLAASLNAKLLVEMADATVLLAAVEEGDPEARGKLLELVYVGANLKFENRAQFFSAAAEAMRRILIDRARRKLAQRHGGGHTQVDADAVEIAAPDQDQHLLDVHEVLDKFAVEHPVHAKVVMLRYFVGMTNEETCEVLGVSVATVKNYWTFARTWLFHEIKNSAR